MRRRCLNLSKRRPCGDTCAPNPQPRIFHQSFSTRRCFRFYLAACNWEVGKCSAVPQFLEEEEEVSPPYPIKVRIVTLLRLVTLLIIVITIGLLSRFNCRGVVFGGLLLCGSSAFRSVVFSSLITRVFYCDGPSRGDSRLLRVPVSVIAFLHIKGLLIETPGNQPPFGE